MEKEIQPLVTAVITTYKRQLEIVRRSLTSIINQSYSNIKIIIVNDYKLVNKYRVGKFINSQLSDGYSPKLLGI